MNYKITVYLAALFEGWPWQVGIHTLKQEMPCRPKVTMKCFFKE